MPGSPAYNARVTRPVGARQTHRHARLKDAVARRHDLPARVPDQPRRIAACSADAPWRQPIRRAASRGNCVSVSSVMTYFTCDRTRRGAHDQRKSAGTATPQQRVQVAELAAFALVAHPPARLGVPAPRTMEQVEGGWRRRRASSAETGPSGSMGAGTPPVLSIELVDPRFGHGEEATRRAGAFPRAHPQNRSTGRSADGRRDWPGSEPPVPRPDHRRLERS